MLILFGMTLLVGCGYDDATPSFNSIDFESELRIDGSDIDEANDVIVSDLDAELFMDENAPRSRCISLVFPVTIDYPDGTSVEYETLMDLKEGIKAYFEANGRDAGHPKLQFPVDLETSDGEIVTAESMEDIKNLHKECMRKKIIQAKKRCFTLVYPVTVVFPNGDTKVVNGPREMKLLIKVWKRFHRGAAKRPKLEVPFDITTKDGNVVTIKSKEDIKAVLIDCRG